MISVGGTAATVTNVIGTTVTLDAAVTASGGAPVLPTWQYRLDYANTGTASATGVVVTDVLPAGLTFIGADNGGANASGTVTWNLGTVAAGASGTLRVRVRPGSATTYANSATLASAELSTVTSNSTSTTTGSLTADKATTTPSGSSSGNVTTATYVITLQNQSPSAAATGITVQDDLAPGFSYAALVSMVGASATTSPSTGDASPAWTGLSIPAGATATITFTVTIANVSPGTYQNYLTVTSASANVLGFDALATAAEDVTIASALGTTGVVSITPTIAPGATLTLTVADPDLDLNPAERRDRPGLGRQHADQRVRNRHADGDGRRHRRLHRHADHERAVDRGHEQLGAAERGRRGHRSPVVQRCPDVDGRGRGRDRRCVRRLDQPGAGGGDDGVGAGVHGRERRDGG